MESVAIALIKMIGDFPESIQIVIVFFILIGGILFLAKSFLSALQGTKFNMPAKKKKRKRK